MSGAVAALSLLAAGGAAAEEVGAGQRVDLALTAGHAAGSAVIAREVREIALGPGRHTVTWAGLAETAAPETLTVAATGARILGYRVEESVYPAAGLAPLLRGAEVVARDARAGRRGRPAVGGTLISLEGGTVLRAGGQLTVLGPSRIEGAPPPARSLSVDLEVPAGAKVGLEVTALLDKVLQHAPRYALRLDAGGARAALSGSVIFTNLSGYALDGARAALARDGSAAPGLYTAGGTWSVSGQPEPFPLSAPLRFGPTRTAEAPLVQAEGVPLTQVTQVTPTVMELLFRDPEPRRFGLTRVTTLDTAALGIKRPLPPGEAAIWGAAQPGSPAPLLARGQLRPGESGAAEISTPEPIVRQVEARQRSGQQLGPCRGTAVWSFAVPEELRAAGAFEIVLAGRKQTLSVRVRGKSGAAVITQPLRTIVRLPRRAPEAGRPRAPENVEIEVRAQDCG